MADPASILQAQILKSQSEVPAPEEVKAVHIQEGGKPAFMALAADQATESSELDPIPMMKAKSYTPMPGRKTHAKSQQMGMQEKRAPFILGIGGGPSSGMSSVAKSIQEDLERSNISVAVVSLLDFYKPLRGNLRKNRSRAGSLVEEENKEEVMREIQEIRDHTDFDDPAAIDYELLIRGVEQLRERKPFNFPVYDKFFKVRLQSETKVQPSDVIIIEGALILCNELLRNMFDLSLFIDTDDDVRLSRRVLKNAQLPPDQQIPLADLLKTYENMTKLAFERFIEPTKKYANIIIPNYGFSTDNIQLDKMTIQGVDVIISDIKQQVVRPKVI